MTDLLPELSASHEQPEAHLRVLGGLSLYHRDRRLPLACRKAAALLGYLAAAPSRTQTRESVACLLWEESCPGRARNSLRQLLFTLRRTFGPLADSVLVSRGEMLALVPEAMTVDLWAFERAVSSDSEAALGEALDFYQGDFLAGVHVPTVSFQSWVTIERERLRQLAIEAHGQLLAKHVQAGRVGPALRLAHRLLCVDPLDEAAHRELMRLYAAQGRLSLAVRQYRTCRQILRRDLGIQPDRETQTLFAELCGRRHRLDG